MGNRPSKRPSRMKTELPEGIRQSDIPCKLKLNLVEKIYQMWTTNIFFYYFQSGSRRSDRCEDDCYRRYLP